MPRSRLFFLVLLAAVVLAVPAQAQCPAFICYLDLVNGAFICPNGTVYDVTSLDPIAVGNANPDCPAGGFGAVVEVNLPANCEGVGLTVEYGDIIDGHTLNVADSVTNDGFGGDGGSLPAGQNAEVHVFDNILRLWSAADNPDDVDILSETHLALTDGALKVVVEDQFVSWGQPYTFSDTPDLERLFFLPDNPVAPDNRTLYVGVNRVVNPIAGTTGRNGCGVRHVLMFTQ